MTCTYPNCRNKAERIPVIKIPTVRTVGESSELVQTDKHTLMVGQPVCLGHSAHYKLADWFGDHDWDAVIDAARAHGVHLEPNVIITFEPIGWTQDARYLEVER